MNSYLQSNIIRLLRAIILSAAIVPVFAGCDNNNALPSPGDSVPNPSGGADGTVESVVEVYDNCYGIRTVFPSKWACSSEQIADVNSCNKNYGWIDESVDTDDSGPLPKLTDPVALASLDCKGLADLRRPFIANHYEATLSVARCGILGDNCFENIVMTYLTRDGDSCPSSEYDLDSDGNWYADADADADSDTDSDSDSDADGDGGASEYSTTNNQVAGVEEPDFIKNDGNHIYILASQGLRVIDAWPPESASEVAFVSIPGTPQKLLLEGDRLVVYSNAEADYTQDRFAYWTPYRGNAECTYGYSCRFTPAAGPTRMQVFDVSDPSSPTLLEQFEFSGGLVAARRIGSQVYTVVHDGGMLGIPGVNLELDADTLEEMEEEYARITAEAKAAVVAAPDEAFLPWIVKGDALNQPISACNSALAAKTAAGESFLSVITLNVDTLSSPSRTLVATNPGFVYSSAEALYVAVDGTDGAVLNNLHPSAENDMSTIHKFNLYEGETTYVGSHYIPGHVLNQFSMDERDGVLRVATSNGWIGNNDLSSNLLTLSEVDGDFKQVGALRGLAPHEDIRSVRFDGTRGFMVTFKNTDPLFVLDLADATAPKVLGELKIPGFSTYMHMMDEDHVLAIGIDTVDQGDFAYFDSVQIQIFDVTDLANPLLLHKHVIGTRGTASEALTNHLAFNYFKPIGMLALPMTICEGGDANTGNYGETMSFNGLMVFDISLVGGISEHGRMSFAAPAIASNYNTCGQWWSESTSTVKRSIFMDDYAFGVSDADLAVAHLDELENILQSIPLE